jgi:hypothetical protein
MTFATDRTRKPTLAEIVDAIPEDLIVGTMCHCDDPEDCSDHWDFFYDATMGTTSEDHVAWGKTLSEDQMRAIAALVDWAHREDTPS